jgi:hypothetical protein
LKHTNSTYQLAQDALREKKTVLEVAYERLAASSSQIIDYEEVIEAGNILPPIDHPNLHHVWVTGTGITHFSVQDARLDLHRKPHGDKALTQAMKNFHNEIASGKHKSDKVDLEPDLFHRGDGTMIVSPEQPIGLPAFAIEGSEETEVVGIYVNNHHGVPHRIGFTLGNEFTDPVKSTIKTAHSKLLPCSIGPELLLGPLPREVRGTVVILRDGQVVWQAQFVTGENHMSQSVENLEHAHFKHDTYRRPGDVHVHFFGSSILSFSQGFKTQAGDMFEISASEFGRPLRNTIEVVSVLPTKTQL